MTHARTIAYLQEELYLILCPRLEKIYISPRRRCNIMNIIILGPQGSGKGTQAKLIAEKKKWPHISTGDIFRDNIKRGTKLGKMAKSIMDKGGLVPDDVTVAIIKDRLAKDDCRRGYVLDGFPRNLKQAKALENIAKIDMALLIDLPDSVAVNRISGRRTCGSCGAIYAVSGTSKKDCDKCGGKLLIRDDDRPAAIKKRLATYHELTEPVIAFYGKQGKLTRIDGKPPVPEVWMKVEKAIG
jgi:adenylate kinase